jgi:hypothetical protein
VSDTIIMPKEAVEKLPRLAKMDALRQRIVEAKQRRQDRMFKNAVSAFWDEVDSYTRRLSSKMATVYGLPFVEVLSKTQLEIQREFFSKFDPETNRVKDKKSELWVLSFAHDEAFRKGVIRKNALDGARMVMRYWARRGPEVDAYAKLESADFKGKKHSARVDSTGNNPWNMPTNVDGSGHWNRGFKSPHTASYYSGSGYVDPQNLDNYGDNRADPDAPIYEKNLRLWLVNYPRETEFAIAVIDAVLSNEYRDDMVKADGQNVRYFKTREPRKTLFWREMTRAERARFKSRNRDSRVMVTANGLKPYRLDRSYWKDVYHVVPVWSGRDDNGVFPHSRVRWTGGFTQKTTSSVARNVGINPDWSPRKVRKLVREIAELALKTPVENRLVWVKGDDVWLTNWSEKATRGRPDLFLWDESMYRLFGINRKPLDPGIGPLKGPDQVRYLFETEAKYRYVMSYSQGELVNQRTNERGMPWDISPEFDHSKVENVEKNCSCGARFSDKGHASDCGIRVNRRTRIDEFVAAAASRTPEFVHKDTGSLPVFTGKHGVLLLELPGSGACRIAEVFCEYCGKLPPNDASSSSRICWICETKAAVGLLERK